MATIVKKSDGTFRLKFKNFDGKFSELYFSKDFSQELLESVRVDVVRLVNARKMGVCPDSATVERLLKTSPEITRKYVRLGLIDSALCGSPVPTLSTLCEEYMNNRGNIKETTKERDKTIVKKLLLFFDPQTRVDKITAWDAEKFCAWLLRPKSEGGLGNKETTFTREIKYFRSVFKKAIKARWIHDNPFIDIKGGSQVDESRQLYLERYRIAELLERIGAFNPELRFAVALARYAGLRIPCEFRKLKFSDFDFERGYFKIDEDTKTGSREIPIFPEIRRELEIYRKTLSDDSDNIARKYRNSKNLWQPFTSALKKLGEKRFVKPFPNLRASLITDLVILGYPEKDITDWVGNSEEVRRIHYLLQRDEDQRRAIAAILAAENETPKFSWEVASQNAPDFAPNPATNLNFAPNFAPINAPKTDFQNAILNGSTSFSNDENRRRFNVGESFDEGAESLKTLPLLAWFEYELCSLTLGEIDTYYDEENACIQNLHHPSSSNPKIFEKRLNRLFDFIRILKQKESDACASLLKLAQNFGLANKHARGANLQ